VARLIRHPPLDHATDLGELVHELLLVLKPPGGVHEHGVEPARLRGGDGVEGDGPGVGARALRHDGHAELVAPDP
jgi:hypothetical protein